MNFKTIFWKDNEWIMGKVLGYSGTTVQSESIDEAKEAPEDAMIEFIKQRIKDGKKIKDTFSFSETKSMIDQYNDKNAILSFITVDPKKANSDFYKTIRTNLTVISGYKERAKKDNLNLSNFLNKALEAKYG